MSNVSKRVAGIDIGKARLDVALHGATGRVAFDNSATGHRRLIQWLRAAQVVRVGLESTGSYSQEVTGALREAGFEVAVLQPLQVRAFAQYGDGYLAALVNYRWLANALWTTDEAVKRLTAG